MSFEYNQVDLEQVESVRLEPGRSSPEVISESDESASKSKEQKRKAQLISFLPEAFDGFDSCISDLIDMFDGASTTQDVMEFMNLTDFRDCSHCRNNRVDRDGTRYCSASDHEKDGSTLYYLIDEQCSIPSFCTEGMPSFELPPQALEAVDNRLEKFCRDQYDIKEAAGNHMKHYTRDSHAAEQLSRILMDLIRGGDYPRFRRAAVKIAWILHIDGQINDSFHPQRADAYLREMDSVHATVMKPGQRAVLFEQSCRSFLESCGLPMYERVLNVEGGVSRKKEMDIHTEFPWGERAIFEVYRQGAHRDKDIQLRQYARLLSRSGHEDATEILLSDTMNPPHVIDERLFFDLLGCHFDVQSDQPRHEFGYKTRRTLHTDADLLGRAEDLSYNEFQPEFMPCIESRQAESRLMARLRALGYEPFLPVFIDRRTYGYCGPTIELKYRDSELLVTFCKSRQPKFIERDGEETLNQRMTGNKPDGRIGWQMAGPRRWSSRLNDVFDPPVSVVELGEPDQSELKVGLLEALVRSDPPGANGAD